MTHASHFDGDTLTLTSPRGTIVLSQGQCASIVIMAEKNGPVGRVRDAHLQAPLNAAENVLPPTIPEPQDPSVDAVDTLHCMASYIHKHWQESKPFLPDSVALDQIAAIQRGDVPGICNLTTNEMTLQAENVRLRAELEQARSDAEGRKRFEQWYAETMAERDQKTEECGFYLQDRNRLAGELGLANTLRDNALAERDRLTIQVAEAMESEVKQWKERAESDRRVSDTLMEAAKQATRERDAARAEAQAAKQEAATLRARKVKLPGAQREDGILPTITARAEAWNACLGKCADAIRAAGIEVEV